MTFKHGHYPWAFVTPTPLLAPHARRAIRLIEADLARERRPGEEGNGGISILADRMLKNYRSREGKPVKAEALYRRIYDILHGKTLATRIELADALLLAVDERIEETDLPTLPAGMKAAREMVEVRSQLKGVSWTLPEREERAKSLMDFTAEYLLQPLPEKWADADEWIKDAAKPTWPIAI
jgi:hypothetical protein